MQNKLGAGMGVQSLEQLEASYILPYLYVAQKLTSDLTIF